MSIIQGQLLGKTIELKRLRIIAMVMSYHLKHRQAIQKKQHMIELQHHHATGPRLKNGISMTAQVP